VADLEGMGVDRREHLIHLAALLNLEYERGDIPRRFVIVRARRAHPQETIKTQRQPRLAA
jgi:hypothetical protein